MWFLKEDCWRLNSPDGSLGETQCVIEGALSWGVLGREVRRERVGRRREREEGEGWGEIEGIYHCV
jgi:hypothetical protein